MSTPKLKLVCDSLCVGNKVTGSIDAEANSTHTVELLWRITRTTEPEEKVVARVPATCNAEGNCRFELSIPAAGPMSYDGRTFGIEWHVRLTGDARIETPLNVAADVWQADRA